MRDTPTYALRFSDIAPANIGLLPLLMFFHTDAILRLPLFAASSYFEVAAVVSDNMPFCLHAMSVYSQPHLLPYECYGYAISVTAVTG